MKAKSLIIGILAAISIIIATEVIYHVSTDIKNKYETKNIPKVVVNSSETEEANLTPKEKEIVKYKSQLLFLMSDEAKISTISQSILNDMRTLLQSKTSGTVSVNKADIEKTKIKINNYWAENSHFGTEDGVGIKSEYEVHLQKLNTYLDNGMQTGKLNVSQLPRFSEDNMQKIYADINNVKVKLLGLGSSVNLSSPTYFTVQNSPGYKVYS